MTVIRSGLDLSHITIDTTSKAARANKVTAQGVAVSQTYTYGVVTPAIALVSTACPVLFFRNTGKRNIYLKSITITPISGATLRYTQDFTIYKGSQGIDMSALATGGTSTTSYGVPFDSTAPISSGAIIYWAAGSSTIGAAVQKSAITSFRLLAQASAAGATGGVVSFVGDDRSWGETSSLKIIAPGECIYFWGAGNGSTVNGYVSIRWVER